jgi:uncharacterized membrane protein YcjF (UPF0283 family)
MGMHGISTWRRLVAFMERSNAIGFRFSRNTWSIRGCRTALARVSSSGLVFSTATRLILMLASTPRFTEFMRLLPLVERRNARIARTRNLSATTGSSLCRRANSSSRRTWSEEEQITKKWEKEKMSDRRDCRVVDGTSASNACNHEFNQWQ